MKYSKTFERDYSFYGRHVDRFLYPVVKPLPRFEFDVSGVSAKHAFFVFDSNGRLIRTSEPDKVARILVTKQSINFHLKMWAEGYNDCLIGIQEYMDEFEDPPDWVERSFRNQVAIAHSKRGGRNG